MTRSFRNGAQVAHAFEQGQHRPFTAIASKNDNAPDHDHVYMMVTEDDAGVSVVIE